MNFANLIVGILAFGIIGIFHPIVIKTEYYFGKKVWPAFLICGMVCVILSLFADDQPGAALAILGFANFWSIRELFEQEQRVKKGWFKAGKHHAFTDERNN